MYIKFSRLNKPSFFFSQTSTGYKVSGLAENSHGGNVKVFGSGCELCLYVWQKKKLKILCIVWEAAWNEMRRDSSEMNPGWSLASANQITTKGSEASE